MTEIQIVPKGVTIEIKEKGEVFTDIYVGAGWDMVAESVDLDLVAACLVDGKLTSSTRLVYFNDKDEPGILLSEDNTTGEGDGDDESLVIDLTKVEDEVNSIAIGIVAYAGSDLSAATNVHLRIVNGKAETDTQVFDVTMDEATTGDTVMHAANLIRGVDGWSIENVSKFVVSGNGTGAVKGFSDLFA